MRAGDYDRGFWEQRWTQALREHGDRVAQRPPNAHLTGELAGVSPGRALDAGCGHGSDALWLAARGWQVTALDFAATALAYARSTAELMGADVAERVDWVEADLGTWTPQPDAYDLVVCLYVHVAGSVEEMVQRMATGVAPGGTLFLVGHRPIDPATGAETAAAGQVQVSVESAVAALDPAEWDPVVAEERPRPVAGSGVDAVIRARRRPAQTVYEAAGGIEGLTRLAGAWHARVMADEVVSHAFSHGFHPEHTERLAAYWAEALGGPATFSEAYGDETSVVRMHSGNGPHDEMDRRAIACFDEALGDVGLADGDRLREVLSAYFAWATTTTMSRYHGSADDVPDGLEIPRWSWDGLVASG